MSELSVKLQTDLDTFSLDVDFECESSGVTLLYGPSGSGKTTVLRAIAGLLKADQCEIRFNGDVWQDGTHFTPPHHRPIGYVFQEASLFPHLSVRKNIEYGYKRVSKQDKRIDFDDAVSLLGVEPLLNRAPGQLSGGERQRVAIARALLTSPSLLLMDEPLAALDNKAKQEIFPYLEQLHTELSIPLLYISHDHNEAARLADRIVLMDDGKVTATGDAHLFMTRLNLPLSHKDTASAIIEGDVIEYDEKDQITWINVAGSRVGLSGYTGTGTRLRVQIYARDVSLALSEHRDTSILNILPVTVLGREELDNSQMMVRLKLDDDQTMLSRITKRSAEMLELHRGKQIFAQVKGIALL
ncbi:molybdenum ABC transporter ATP-binding protein [Solemya velum gill symbiont]|uniref:molybdenum ABC transporter ATP-binding protein n=1 Tax=Solemya velum gill symbiont TaxID=2340 RepID=UPI000997A9D6|nr:molybdenum ABC transporter ATP-binding protein [Solemya velum gill symbiont]OOY52715.1 molybdenum ABC transporter ATP-binding protein [Solemya velum gill symbiont]OOY65764.1 molybdenum ABC transporter ATP-binding protein [Solemya velum gill symbiont]OOY67840.1 molybdenum ABC transporter ATP-binding protein [Solemya velum gill symbiont]OOY70256.1 molybdenum ABC transporter ATP-binding protein [Solemya velum gill symbiont]OOY80038.1 molybdenum ABC transporter ATP-binding protein [Solemya velu